MDAAHALQSSPIFQLLGRVDLAKLAGELEDISLAHDDVLIREGDAGDAFFVVREGTAVIQLGGDESPRFGASLRPGQVIGEMAILTGAPRNATIRAHGPLRLWKMTAVRFLDLLAGERQIALAVERSLCQRLADTNADVEVRRADAAALARLCLSQLGSGEAEIFFRLSTRARWPQSTLSLLAEHAGPIDRLCENGVLARRENGVVYVMHGLVGSLAESSGEDVRAWLVALSAKAAIANQISEAIDLALLGSDLATAAHLAVTNGASLILTVPEAQRRRWAEAITGVSEPEQYADAVHMALGLSAANKITSGNTTLHFQRGWLRAFLGRYVVEGRILSAVVALGLVATGWLLPVPTGLAREGFAALMIIIASVPLLLSEALPRYLVVLLMAGALVVPGMVPVTVALAGFSSTSWMLILVLFATSGAVGRSGLMYRVALTLLKVLPPNLLVQAAGLFGMGGFLSLGVASGNGRVALAAPAVRDLAEAMHLPHASRGSAFLGLASYYGFAGMGSLIVTGSTVGLVAVGALPAESRAAVNWVPWLLAAIVPHLVWMALVLTMLVLTVRPPLRTALDQRRLALQIDILGPLTRDEILGILALLGLGIGFATRIFHGVPDVWTAIGVTTILFAAGALDDRTFRNGVDWGVMLFYGVLMSLGGVMSHLGLDRWIASMAGGVLADVIGTPYAFVPALAVLCSALRFVFPKVTLAAMMALIAVPLATAAGYSPLVPLLTLVIASDHSALPYVNETYPIMVSASDGVLFTPVQARLPLMLEMIARILAVCASIPVWQAMGLC